MKLSKAATISLILIASIIACLPSCGSGNAQRDLMERKRIHILASDTVTMPDGHVYFFNTGNYLSGMCHAEGFCKKHK